MDNQKQRNKYALIFKQKTIKAATQALYHWQRVKVWNYSDTHYDVSQMYIREMEYNLSRYKDCFTPGKSPFHQNLWPEEKKTKTKHTHRFS